MNLIPQFGFLELILIAVIALIVVGPRDLPKLMRSLGQFVAKARALAGEFTAAFDQMARETEMDELRKEIDAIKNDNVITQTKRDIEKDMSEISKDIRSEEEKINKVSDAGSAEASEPAKP